MQDVNEKRFESLRDAEAGVFEAIEKYVALAEDQARVKSERWYEKEETYRNAASQLVDCEARLKEIAERQSAMENEVGRIRLKGDHLGEAALQDEYAALEDEKRNLEARIKEARAIVGSATYQRYGEPSEPGSALAKETLRQSPLKGYDGFRGRVISVLDSGRERVRGSIY